MSVDHGRLDALSFRMGDAVATSPQATVDSENNRLFLTDAEDDPVILTIGTGKKARTVSARELAISIND